MCGKKTGKCNVVWSLQIDTNTPIFLLGGWNFVYNIHIHIYVLVAPSKENLGILLLCSTREVEGIERPVKTFYDTERADYFWQCTAIIYSNSSKLFWILPGHFDLLATRRACFQWVTNRSVYPSWNKKNPEQSNLLEAWLTSRWREVARVTLVKMFHILSFECKF
jgi:hypothetical protein